MFPELKQHHIGCLVESIDEFKIENENVWDAEKYSQTFFVSSQDVQVCFLQMSSDTCLELVQPGTSNKPLSRLLSKSLTYYHIGFITRQFDDSVKRMIDSNYKLLSVFDSEAFGGKRCAFFYHPQIHLIELIESDSEP